MKFKPYEGNDFLYGENHFLYDFVETENRIDIYLKSKKYGCKCPFCGEESNSLHATYQRTFQDMPMRLKSTYVHANVYKYNCTNPDCDCKVFMEPLPFVSPSQVRTDCLNALILSISMYVSNEGTSRIMSYMGVTISNDSVQRLYDRLVFKDDPDVEAVGIDDVAIRKGQKYATAIYDMKDHHMIALLEGRDGVALREWIKSHDKIRIVARDRASAYASAISEILPECVQVADRFHIMQNLLERMKDIFKDEVPNEIFIRNGEVLDKAPEMVSVVKEFDSSRLEGVSYDNTPPKDSNGEEIKFKNKNRNINGNYYKKLAENRKKNRN